MKGIIQVFAGLLICAEVFGADQGASQPSASAEGVAQRIFRDRKEGASDVPVKRQLKLSVAELTAVRQVGTPLTEITRVFGRSNLRSIPDDDVLVVFYRIEIVGEDRQAFLEKSKLPDVQLYSIELWTKKGTLTSSSIRPAAMFPENRPNKRPETNAGKESVSPSALVPGVAHP